MATNKLTLTEELVLALYLHPFKAIISYLSPNEAITQADFNKSGLTKKYWLFEECEGVKSRGKKHLDPDCLFRIFGVCMGESALTAHEQMLTWVTNDFNKFSHCSWIALHMNKYKSLSAWMAAMRNSTIPGDEIALYALARMYNKHTLVYTKSSIWSTIVSSMHLSYEKVCNYCDIKLAYFGRGHYVELIKKSAAQNITTNFSYAENVYDSGYYGAVVNPNIVLHQPTKDMVNSELVPYNANNVPTTNNYPRDHTLDTVQSDNRCPVHGCETDIEPSTSKLPIPQETNNSSTAVQFPASHEVCRTSIVSSLVSYNPLKENKPNLNMTDLNTDPDDLKLKALFSCCKIKLRRLSTTDIDFLSGSHLLPSLNNNVGGNDNETEPVSAPHELTVHEEVAGLAGNISTANSPTIHTGAVDNSGNITEPAWEKINDLELHNTGNADQITTADAKAAGQTTTPIENDTLASAPQSDKSPGEVAGLSEPVGIQLATNDETVSAPQSPHENMNEEVAGQSNQL